MSASRQTLYSNVHQTDPLNFWSNHGLDYSGIADFLDLDKNALSKIGGVSKDSVRFDERIPRDLKDRLEQIANIISLVAEYFDGDVHKTALWFRTPNPSLGEVAPRDMIRLGRHKKLFKFVYEAKQANANGDR